MENKSNGHSYQMVHVSEAAVSFHILWKRQIISGKEVEGSIEQLVRRWMWNSRARAHFDYSTKRDILDGEFKSFLVRLGSGPGDVGVPVFFSCYRQKASGSETFFVPISLGHLNYLYEIGSTKEIFTRERKWARWLRQQRLSACIRSNMSS